MYLRENGEKVCTGCMWLRMGISEHGKEPSVSIKGGEFLDKLSDCWLLKKRQQDEDKTREEKRIRGEEKCAMEGGRSIKRKGDNGKEKEKKIHSAFFYITSTSLQVR